PSYPRVAEAPTRRRRPQRSRGRRARDRLTPAVGGVPYERSITKWLRRRLERSRALFLLAIALDGGVGLEYSVKAARVSHSASWSTGGGQSNRSRERSSLSHAGGSDIGPTQSPSAMRVRARRTSWSSCVSEWKMPP